LEEATVLRKELTAQTRLAPLILRLVLAAIFIYHGVDKFIGKGNGYGFEWAVNLWTQRASPPKAATAALKDLKAEEGDKAAAGAVENAKTILVDAYEQDKEKKAPPSEALTTLDKFKKTPEAEKFSKVNEAEATLGQAYSNKNRNVPELLKHPSIQLTVAVAEVACGAALLFGLLTRLAAILMMVVQVGAIYMVTGVQGLAPTEPGGFEFEYNVVLIAVCLVVALRGGGGLSLDHYLFRRRRHVTTTAAATTPAAV
jgi:uncharacterized membrane protein YphA (DoxX/SURF4 family)